MKYPENKIEPVPNVEFKVKNKLGEIFDQHKSPAHRIYALRKRFRQTIYEDSPITQVVPYQDLKAIIDKINDIDPKLNRTEFQDVAYDIISPLIELERTHSELAKRAADIWKKRADEIRVKGRKEDHASRREEMRSEGDKLFVSDVLMYKQKGDTIFIHIAPSQDIPLSKLRTDIKQGLKNLAKIVEANEEIKAIYGRSWIITKNPRLVELFGFTTYPSTTAHQEDSAIMSRLDFLKRYL